MPSGSSAMPSDGFGKYERASVCFITGASNVRARVPHGAGKPQSWPRNFDANFAGNAI
jgi:hypothetical protein